MTFQIQAVHLFSRAGQRRSVKFKLNELNIITGGSGKGKTSLIDIIQYCLGSTGFTVPSGVIRNHVEVFCLELVSKGTRILIARPAPETGRQVNTRMHYSTGFIPDDLKLADVQSNTDVDTAIELLSREIGIQENRTDVGAGTRSSFSVSVKHTNHFTLQHQDEIASQSVLFHGQALEWVPQTIRDVLPYFLGAVDVDHLSKLEDLRMKKRELRRLRAADSERSDVSAPPLARRLLREAVSLSLIADPGMDDAGVVLEVLGGLLDFEPSEFVEFADEDQMTILVDNRERLRMRLAELRSSRREVVALMQHESRFSSEAGEQKARLETLNLLPNISEAETICPLCFTSRPAGDSLAATLHEHLTAISAELEDVRGDTPQLQKVLDEYDKELNELSAELRSNQEEIEASTTAHDAFIQARELNLARAELRGKVRLYLSSTRSQIESSFTQSRIAELQEQVDLLERLLDPEGVQERLSTALALIGQMATEVATELQLEHAPAPTNLDIRKLTVVVDTPEGRYPLREIGSAENWLGYHLAVLIGLHSYLGRTNRPMPRFLFLDQPSQVYFPADHKDPSEEDLGEDDRESLIAIYSAVRKFIATSPSGFQVIVTEHADLEEEWFQDAIVERWRGHEALIPPEWLSGPSGDLG
ncbi:hypothetical protein J2Y41_002260 [Arthrobacter sp. 1088]|uniref:DUF3732 domain-containing protein n=1 Tax=Arthrobacter sp. 1088 TaxID=2817768 RepID=UPI00285D7E7C|nr:DUF3732 domain-containing protein [Arthrobacter sp. 1088]MDR6686699.1 hypothetical protein [Arthrobacter sp. 1088]